MALNTFDSHLSEVGTSLKELQKVVSNLEGRLKRHTHNAYDTLATGDYAGRAVTKIEYDNAITTINNLINTFMPAGNGTNIDQYLYEVP